jgi:hypothetical protein
MLQRPSKLSCVLVQDTEIGEDEHIIRLESGQKLTFKNYGTLLIYI